MPRFFINRPIFAWVIAILIMLTGLLAIKTLPVSQYPAIAPPSIIYDSLGFQRSAQKLRGLARQHDARIIYPHDPEQMGDLKLLPDCYD